MKTEIINSTKQLIELKEGNAGAFRSLKQLNAGGKYSIKVDPNATYREYMLATGKKGQSIILTSDDFSEYKVIEIEVDKEGIYRSKPSQPRRSGSSSAPEPSSTEGEASHGDKSKAGDEPKAGTDLPPSSSAGSHSAPSCSAIAGGKSETPVPPSAGVQSASPAPSVAGGPSDSGNSNRKEHVPWYRKLKLFR